MSDFDTKENCFGQDIEEYLITRGGYTKGATKKLNRKPVLGAPGGTGPHPL